MICVKVLRTNFITAYRFVHKLKKTEFAMDNPTAYVRLLDGAQQFQVNFLFKDNSLRIERQFNFDRRLTEPVEAFLNRVKQNLAKIASRKNKRLKTGSDEKEVTVELFKNDSPVSGSEICENVFFNGNTTSLKLRLNDIDYTVSVNCPWVTDITLPSSMMIGFPVYPARLDLLFAKRSDCLFRWFKTGSQKDSNLTLPSVEWKDLGTNFMYLPSADDLGCHLKLECTPCSGPVTGPTSTAVSTNTVQAGPGFCPFETRHAFTSERLDGNKFRVMSYNILADMYAETEAALTELFPYCPRYALKLDYRKQLLLKEVIGYNADLICLQEVDDKVFYNDLVPVFSPLGYSGKYSQKGGTVREGVSCFYSNKRFECQYNDTVILGEVIQKSSCLKDLWETIKKKEPLKLRVIDRHTALQILVLESKDKKDELLVVGNTHLYFHPDADHVRLLQAGIIMNYLTNFVSTIIPSNPGKHISLIVCGDFNSVPECGIYKLMTTKHVPQDFIDWRSNKEEEVEGVELNQPWNISSACGTPQFTNFTVGFADCLDYIFYQNDRLSVDQVIPMPTEEELRQHVAIPSVVFPSDHIALVADLSWNKN